METEYVNLTLENLETEHLCCLIRSKKPHPGVEAKRQWLAQRLAEGHVFRKARVKGAVFIEYAPLETAWTPVSGENYVYLYCLWVDTPFQGQGHGTALMESCIADARAGGRSGVCMLGAKRQKHWLSSQDFARRFGFQTVDTTPQGYALLALSLDGTAPCISPCAKAETIPNQGLTVFYSPQCPYVQQAVQQAAACCKDAGLAGEFIPVDTQEKAKSLPCVFNNCAVFFQGRFETVNLPDAALVKRLAKRAGAG